MANSVNESEIKKLKLLFTVVERPKAEFYLDVQSPDFSAAHRYFRVTDTQMVKALFGKKARHIFEYDPNAQASGEKKSGANAKKIPTWLIN